MNFRKQIIKMQNKIAKYDCIPEYITNPSEVLLMIETKTFVYSFCQYISEDHDWFIFLYTIDMETWECVSVKKDEVVAISLTDSEDHIPINEKGENDRVMYQ